ncbi:MAG TPA: hypothetical protein VK338_03365 [Candidatus Nitrosocosmicus sp.]|nr:hypothetical protein [Candidatus Nitrosocosmicus sp.]
MKKLCDKLPGMSEYQTFEHDPAAIERAAIILNDHEKIFIDAAIVFQQAAQATEDKYNQARPRSILPSGHDLIDIKHVIYGQLSENALSLFNHPDATDEERYQLSQVINWSIDTLVKVDENDSVKVKSRKRMINNQRVPYAMHPLISVPYFMRAHGLGNNALSLALAFTHDSQEEGILLDITPDGKVIGSQIESPDIKAEFPELGEKLAIGIPSLTESLHGEVEEYYGEENHLTKIQDFISSARQTYPDFFLDFDKHPRAEGFITRAYVHDLVEYGGLAIQIQSIVRALQEKGENDLAISIIEVEFGDRMSDLSDMERLLDKYDENYPNMTRHIVMARISRMRNMYDKLNTLIQESGYQEHFKEALIGFPAIAYAKLKEINAQLKQKGVPEITSSDIEEFYKGIFNPLQTMTDEFMSEFIEYKVSNILGIPEKN